MMKVSFPEADAAYLRNKVADGCYSSISEAIRDAVRKQREQDQSWLLAALMEGERDIQEGRSEPLTKELFDQLVTEGIAAGKRQNPPFNPDVMP